MIPKREEEEQEKEKSALPKVIFKVCMKHSEVFIKFESSKTISKTSS